MSINSITELSMLNTPEWGSEERLKLGVGWMDGRKDGWL